MSDLRCDCNEEARPILRDADKLPWPHPVIVWCDTCGAVSEPRETEAGAMWAWEHCERFNKDGDPVGIMKGVKV